MGYKLKLVLCLNLMMAFSFSGCWQDIHAQNAPITTIATVGNAVSGQQVTVPITVANFNNIGALSLSLDYDNSKLQFVSGSQNPLLSGVFNMGDNDLGSCIHRIMIGWFGSGASLPEGSWIVNLTFTYVTGSPALQWFEMGPSCEYLDVNTTVLNDSPTPTYYINGRICGAIPNPGTVAGSSSICQGYRGVNYSISPMANVIGYNWVLPQGATIVSGINTNSIIVDYSATAVSGDITVCGVNECGSGPVSLLSVTVNHLPAANAGNDTIIGHGTSAQLHAASGGTGTYNYHWSPEDLLVNPDMQNTQTVQLTSSALFTLEVTDVTGLCQSSDQMAIAISGGSLSANPTVLPTEICQGQYSQLFANVGGGSGVYSYAWTSVPPGNPAWSSSLPNPVVSPDATTSYHLTVSDGYNAINGSTTLTVNQLPSAMVSGGGEVCDDGSQAGIRIDFTGIPPWSFSCSNGINSVTYASILTSPYWIYTNVPGTYFVTMVQDSYCFGTSTGIAVVQVNPVPLTPAIYQTGTNLISDASTGNQWYLNGQLIPEATGQIFAPMLDGAYSDIVTNNGCCSDTSNILEVLITGYDITAENIVSLYPNPATDQVTLKFGGFTEKALKITLLTSTGVPIKSLIFSENETGNEIIVNTNSLATGIYFLKINTGRTCFCKKILIFRM